VEVKGLWRTLVETGQVPAEELLAHLRQTSRDHARTPMQWSAQAHGGFTTGAPWLAVNPNHAEINAASQVDDPNSVYHHHRRLIALRREIPALVHGAYLDIDPAHPHVFAYTRTLGQARYAVLINFCNEPTAYELPGGLRIVEAMIDNVANNEVATATTSLSLAPWQGAVYRLA
jgi:oligo-1,6-glucosidase